MQVVNGLPCRYRVDAIIANVRESRPNDYTVTVFACWRDEVLTMRTRSNLPSLFLIAAIWAIASSASFAQTPSEYLITGRVFDESNRGVEKVRVCAVPADYIKVPQVRCGLSDLEGNFVINAGRPARYRIFPEKSAAGYQWQRSEFFRNPSLPLLDVVLAETNPTASISVPLGQKNGALVGKSVDAITGRAVENVRFTMCQVADPRTCWPTIVRNSEGAFNIPAAHVPFTLKITSDGYEDWWGSNGYDKNSPISVAPGARMELVCLLRRKPETAHRPLTEAEKQPLVDLAAPVQLSPADRIELNYYPRHTRLEWQPLEGAAYYLVEIDVCDGRDRELRECVDPKPFSTTRNLGPVKVQGTNYEFDFVGRQPGRWRVWAVDSLGQEGFKSPWRIIFYLK